MPHDLVDHSQDLVEVAKFLFCFFPLGDVHSFRNEVDDLYKVKMSSLQKYARQCMSRQVLVRAVQAKSIQSEAAVLCDFDLSRVPVDEVRVVETALKMECFRQIDICGFVVWFEVRFPSDLALSTSPYEM